MKLNEYLTSTKTSPVDFAIAIGMPIKILARILTGERVPRKTAMAKIVIATNGLVQPNDFYADAIAALKELPS
jgi:hypothetical protein